MKRLISLAFVAVFAAFVACEKENTVSPVKEHKTISATIPAGGLTTRVALTQDETDKKLIKLSWEDTDVITVNGVDFVIVPTSISADGKTADFDSGSAPDPTPDGAGKYNITCSNLPGSFSSQTQAADGSTEHLKYGVIITGADSYADVTFSEAWASQHGATIALSSVLRLRALLPAAIASTVKKVIFKASEDDFAGGKTLEVTLTNPGTAGTDNILDVYATLPAAADITTSDDVDLVIQFQVSDNENDKYTAYRKIAAGTDFIKPGAAQYIGIDCSNITSYANASNTGIGSSSNPYLIGDKYQLDYLHTAMESGTTYVKMVDDVDMTGVDWTVLNNAGSYDKVINLDGNHKTISNLAGTMFYVFKGSVENLTLDNPSITAGSKKGAFAQFIQGTNNYLNNLDVKNVTAFAASSGPCGGLVGLVNSGSGSETTASFEDCDVTNVVVNSSKYAGGLIGSVDAKVILNNCTCTGCVVANTNTNSTDAGTGGLIGKASVEVAITNCAVSKSGSTGSVTGKYFTGGLVGSAVKCNISRSHADVNVTGTYYVGGLIGDMNTTTSDVEVSECYYKGGTVSGTRYCGGLVGQKQGASYGITINNCYVTGSVTATNRYVGGLLGSYHEGNSAVISNCYASGTVTVTNGFVAGGLIGWVEVDGLNMTKCLAWNSSVSATYTTDNNVHYSSGAIIGYTSNVKVTLTSNYRKKNFTFSDCAGNSANVLTLNSGDKNNAALSATSTYIRPYHGKKETGETTISGFANNAGITWSGSIWDTTTETPTLKNNPE